MHMIYGLSTRDNSLVRELAIIIDYCGRIPDVIATVLSILIILVKSIQIKLISLGAQPICTGF